MPQHTLRSKARLRKVQCEDCTTILYGSAAALRENLPTCACGGSFTVPNPADLELIDPLAFEQLLASLSTKAHNQLMRELGYTDAVQHNAGTLARMARSKQCFSTTAVVPF